MQNLATILSQPCSISYLDYPFFFLHPTVHYQHSTQKDLSKTQGRSCPSSSQNHATSPHPMQSKNKSLTVALHYLALSPLWALTTTTLSWLCCFSHTGCLTDPWTPTVLGLFPVPGMLSFSLCAWCALWAFPWPILYKTASSPTLAGTLHPPCLAQFFFIVPATVWHIIYGCWLLMVCLSY